MLGQKICAFLNCSHVCVATRPKACSCCASSGATSTVLYGEHLGFPVGLAKVALTNAKELRMQLAADKVVKAPSTYSSFQRHLLTIGELCHSAK